MIVYLLSIDVSHGESGTSAENVIMVCDLLPTSAALAN
jgi:hypothetical protein